MVEHDQDEQLAAEQGGLIQQAIEEQAMKYESQAIAKWYWLAALALFAVQVLMGLVAGYIYVQPNFLSELLPFNIVRMLHSNALIVWLLLGFFGAAY